MRTPGFVGNGRKSDFQTRWEISLLDPADHPFAGLKTHRSSTRRLQHAIDSNCRLPNRPTALRLVSSTRVRRDEMAPVGFENKVAFVWKVADKLRGGFKQHEYGSVMLPAWTLCSRPPRTR
jgi:hypothetical protein